MTRSIAMELKRDARRLEAASEGLLLRFFRGFRGPMRRKPDIEQTAALTRAERLFEVNFRNTWTR